VIVEGKKEERFLTEERKEGGLKRRPGT